MKRLNDEHLRQAMAMANACPYFQLLSMELLSVARGTSRLVLHGGKKHLQPFEQFHGGVFASLLDAAAFWAVYCDLEDERDGLTTVDLKVNYLGSMAGGDLYGEGRRIRFGRSIAYAEASLYDGDRRLVAHGTSLLMVLPGKGGFRTSPLLPPKFLSE